MFRSLYTVYFVFGCVCVCDVVIPPGVNPIAVKYTQVGHEKLAQFRSIA
jgi:hypothetical protein